MASGIVSVKLEGERQVRQALREAPSVANTFIRQVFLRNGQRWRKSFKRTQLRGRPGILAKKMQKLKDKNVTRFVTGKFESLAVFFKISRFLRWHTEGATIRKRGGGGSFLLPKRLKFQQTVNEHIPRIVTEVGDAARRAVQVAFERRQGRVNRNLRRVG